MYLPLFHVDAAAKDLGPGAIIGVVCCQRRRIVAYSAYIFKALGVTSAWGLCGMHPGASGTLIVPLWHSTPFWPMICADGVNFSDFIINWMDIPSSKEAFTPDRCNSFKDSISFDSCQFILSVSCFYCLIYFLVFCFAFRLDRLFVDIGNLLFMNNFNFWFFLIIFFCTLGAVRPPESAR